MSEQKTHWRSSKNQDYLGAFSLAPEYKDVVLTIDYAVKDVKIKSAQGVNHCVVAHFVEQAEWLKPMVMNVGNSKIIEKFAKSEFIEDWRGIKIQVFVGRHKGERCLRLRDFAPRAELPDLLPNTETWTNAVTHMVSNGFTIDQVEKKYKLSVDSKAQLLKDVSEKIAETSESKEGENV
jgi:hypothetical protein